MARALARRFAPAATVELDWYYRDLSGTAPAERARVNFDRPEAIDDELFLAQLRSLRSGRPVERPAYDFAAHSRRRERQVLAPAATVIVEGFLALWWAEARALYDAKIFVDAPEEVRLARRLRRDTAARGRDATSVREQWAATAAPMHREFVEPTRAWADWVADGRLPLDELVESLAAEILNPRARSRILSYTS